MADQAGMKTKGISNFSCPAGVSSQEQHHREIVDFAVRWESRQD
jgi:hypothetical protein